MFQASQSMGDPACDEAVGAQAGAEGLHTSKLSAFDLSLPSPASFLASHNS